MNNFRYCSDEEMSVLNGGALGGAVAGYIIGVCVGGVLAAVCSCDKDTQGSQKQGPAMMTTFTATVLSCTAIGACLPI